MRPRAFHIAVVLVSALAALWGWSMTRRGVFVLDGTVRCTVGGGGVAIAWSQRDQQGLIRFGVPPGLPSVASFRADGMTARSGLGYAEVSGKASIVLAGRFWYPRTYGGPTVRLVYLPLWPVLLLALPVGLWCWRNHQSIAAGHCARCRYDLRAIPTGGPCPECGHRAVTVVSAVNIAD